MISQLRLKKMQLLLSSINKLYQSIYSELEASRLIKTSKYFSRLNILLTKINDQYPNSLLSTTYKRLTLFRKGFFGAAHGLGGGGAF